MTTESVSVHAAVLTPCYRCRTALPIVGVRVTGANDTFVDTYALLVAGSDRTFCLPLLLDELQLQGKDTCFTIHTLNTTKRVNAKYVSLNITPLVKDYDVFGLNACICQRFTRFIAFQR